MGHGPRVRAGARVAAGGSPVDSPSDEPSGAEIGRARPARKRSAGRKKNDYITRLPFGEWDVSRGVTQADILQEKLINHHPAVRVA